MAEGSRLDLSLHQTGRIRLLSLFARRPNGPGGESGVAPPVPMPNTEVKRSSAHDTRVTKPWENRPVPGPFGRRASARHAGTWYTGPTSKQPTRGGAVVARRAHNPKVSGSNPLPATRAVPVQERSFAFNGAACQHHPSFCGTSTAPSSAATADA